LHEEAIMTTALLILDMQNYFFQTAEKQAGYKRLIPALNELVQAFDRAEGTAIYNIISVHKADRSTWSRNMLRHNAGCLLEGTHEAEVVADLFISPRQITVPKTRHSAFIRTDLERKLRSQGVDRVVLSGVYTHGCVALSAIDAWSLDFEVAIASNCVFSHRVDLVDFVVERLRSMFRIAFLTNEQLMQDWLLESGNQEN
jgi:nicotinamidase-related amidase